MSAPTSPVITEFAFGAPAGFRLSGTATHHETVITVNLDQPVVHEHQFVVAGTDFVNKLLRQALATPSPSIQFRYGIKVKEEPQWQPWQEHIILSHAVAPESRGTGSGSVLRVVSADQLYAMDRARKVTSRKGKISAIVRQIAQENSLEAVVEDTSTSGVYIQSFETDAAFIRQRLCPRAVSAKGAGQYLFFVRDNVLHFHSPDYQAAVHAVNYHASSAFEMVASEHGQQLFAQGVAGARLVVHDPYTGETREVLSDPRKTLRYADSLYPFWNLKGGMCNHFYHLGQNEPTEVAAMAQSVYDSARASSNNLEVTFTSYVDIRVGNFLEVIHDQTAEPSPFGGLYHVIGAVHRIKDAALTSTFKIQRGETVKLFTDTLTQGPDNQARLSLEAPGRTLNRTEMIASRRTTGGGNETSATLYREVTDASHLPT